VHPEDGAPSTDSAEYSSASEVTLERRRLLREAARTVFTQKGWSRARTRDIAQEAGVTETVLYRYFPSKEDLFEGAILEPLEGLVADLTELEPSYEAVKEL
jgi:AcrR family transcriptional regulator